MAFSYIFTLPISRYAYHVWLFTGFCLNRAKGYKPIPKLFAFMAQSLSLGKHLDYIQGIVQGLFIVQSKLRTPHDMKQSFPKQTHLFTIVIRHITCHVLLT